MGETLQICKRICTTEEASHLLELLRATYQTLGPGSVTNWAELCLRIGGGCNLSSPDQSHKEFLLIQVMLLKIETRTSNEVQRRYLSSYTPHQARD